MKYISDFARPKGARDKKRRKRRKKGIGPEHLAGAAVAGLGTGQLYDRSIGKKISGFDDLTKVDNELAKLNRRPSNMSVGRYNALRKNLLGQKQKLTKKLLKSSLLGTGATGLGAYGGYRIVKAIKNRGKKS